MATVQSQIFIDRLDEMRLKGALKNKVLIGPKSVNIHITNECNLSCIFCWDRSPLVKPRKPGKEHLELGRLKKVVSDCAEMGVQSICLEGGEVFLYPGIYDLCAFIKSKGLYLEVYSNCAFERPRQSPFHLIDRINVNLSAVNEKHYQRIHGRRGNGVFRKVLGNLLYVSKMKRKSGRPWLQMIYVINELNYGGVRALIDIGARLSADYVKFKLIEATEETKTLLLTPHSMAVLKKDLSLIRRRGSKIKHNASEILQLISGKSFMKNTYSIGKTAWHNDRFFYYNAFDRGKVQCYVGWFYGFIDSQGRVIAPCDNVGIALMGNINKQSYKKIWFSKRFERFRSEAIKNLNPLTKKWQECRYCGFIDFNKKITELMR